MKVTREAFRVALEADSVSSTVVSATTTALTFGSGEGLKWAKGMVANITGTGATAANNRQVRAVASVSGNVVTLGAALSVAPAAGDVLGTGFVQWVRPSSASEQLAYEGPIEDDSPIPNLLTDATDPRCIAVFQEALSRVDEMERYEEPWRVRIFSRWLEWAEGLAERLRWRFNADHSALTVSGMQVIRLRVEDMITPASRVGQMHERIVPIRLHVAKVYP